MSFFIYIKSCVINVLQYLFYVKQKTKNKQKNKRKKKSIYYFMD